jgi:hypothetical protein
MMNLKGCQMKWSWPIVKRIPRNFLVKPSKTTEHLSQYSRSQGRDLNPGSPEHEAGVQTI